MGLDITAYEGIGFAPPGHGIDEDGRPDSAAGYDGAFINPHYPSRADDLPNPCVFADCRDQRHFRIGSYSGYGRWRESLAELAGYPAVKSSHGLSHSEGAWAAAGGPFHELIDFSDCEGTIGPRASAKLSADFADWRERAQAFAAARQNGRFLEVYEQFAQAFAMAAEGGAVCLH